jgi:uncharacterized protein YggE
MKKAREVSQLVEALTRFGLSPDAVHLQGVHIETASGTLLKSSSARYHLKVKTEKLDQLTGLLDIIAEQKNASLDRIEWKYPEDEAREQGLESAIAKGKAKAEKVAAAMGVKLLGVYDFMENTFDEEVAGCHGRSTQPGHGGPAQQDNPCECRYLVQNLVLLEPSGVLPLRRAFQQML